MIAMAGLINYRLGRRDQWDLDVTPNLRIGSVFRSDWMGSCEKGTRFVLVRGVVLYPLLPQETSQLPTIYCQPRRDFSCRGLEFNMNSVWT
ncbi:MAG: hypothetical protein Ct9H300mP19_15660 [Dehalococcoidia bacterium]|nr:MAG: hypothetical protein Ct9H300mP19_15660 [Dehalococcoidia bacterium]